MKNRIVMLAMLALPLLLVTCGDDLNPTQSPIVKTTDTVWDTTFDTAVVVFVDYDTIWDTLFDTTFLLDIRYDTTWDTLFRVDTLYLDSIKYNAIDMFEVGYAFAERVLLDSTDNPGGIWFSSPGVCFWRSQIHASLECDFFKVYGFLYVKQGGNIPQGDHYFVVWMRYSGTGEPADTANWDMFDIEWH